MLLLAALFDWLNIGIGALGGVVFSILGFLLTYRSSWRNLLTRELTIQIKSDTAELHGDEFAMIKFAYSVNCTHDEELSINRMFIKLPRGLQSNTPPNATIGEMFFGDDGRYHLISKPLLFKFGIEDSYTLRDPVLMGYINEKKLTKIVVAMETNKYGTVASNKIILKNIRGKSTTDPTLKRLRKVSS